MSGGYYEDIEPRFANNTPPSRGMQQMHDHDTINEEDDEELQAGARSPAMSERSNFTSISQRGINPRWNPPPPGPPGAFGPPIRRPVNRNEMNILNSNPDFQIPTGRGGGGQGRGNMIPGSAYPGL
jgi:hypothetical protein